MRGTLVSSIPILACIGAAACGGSGSTTGPGAGGPLTIDVADEDEALHINPGSSERVSFQLLDQDQKPVPDRTMRFAIIDSAQGATLSFDSAVTNRGGSITLQIIVGAPAKFRVRASADHAANKDIAVFVDSDTYGAATVVPLVEDEDARVTTIQLFFFDRNACSRLPLEKPPESLSVRRVRTLPASGTAPYSSISTSGSHAVIGLGISREGGVVQAACVDLPGAALSTQGTVRVFLPLRILWPSAQGDYLATSVFHWQAVLPAAKTIAGAWMDIAVCAPDPSGWLLDATLDALPGPVGAKLAARRGMLPVAAGAPTSPPCREAKDAQGRRSHDDILAGAFPMPRPADIKALAGVAREASHLFEEVRLHSSLTLSTTSTPGYLRLDHHLDSVEFLMDGVSIPVRLLDSGWPATAARFITVQNRRDELTIAQHGFSLRLGSVSRAAFAQASLKSRGLPMDFAALVTHTAGYAAAIDQLGMMVMGCAALDALLCPDIGEAGGCLQAACTAGLAKTAARLDAGFAELDGADLDFFIGGGVSVIDTDQDRKADALGSAKTGDVGVWSGELRGRIANTAINGPWTADRVKAP